MYPIHLNLGFRVFPFYEGAYFFLAILGAALLGIRRLKQAGLDPGLFLDSLTWILLGSFLGARLFHFGFWELETFLRDPASFFRFWEGGMSITGGLAGGVLASWFCFRRAGYWRYFAALAPAVLLGQALGRLGCFLNGDAWGIPTSLPWGIAQPRFGTVIPGFLTDTRLPSDAWTWSVALGYSDPSSLVTVPLHPTQLYEALGDLLLLALVAWQARRSGPTPRVAWLFAGGYSLLRFGLEFLHGDRSGTVWAGMTALQLALLAIVLASLAGGFRRRA